MNRGYLKKFFYSPYSLSVIFCLIIIYFLPDLFSKYKAKIIEKGETRELKEIIYYDDLNGDGNSEKICSFISSDNHHAIQVFDNDGGIIDQWNLKGHIAGFSDRVLFGDFNNDGQKEIFSFSEANDSIFLYIFEPVENGEFLVKYRFISSMNKTAKDPDYYIKDMYLKSLTNDSIRKFIFVISSSTATPERSIYIYNIVTDNLIQSPISATIIHKIKFTDLNNDNTLEIIGNTYACGNFPDTLDIPFNDYSAWLMTFDNNLNFVFKPLEFPGFHTRVMVQPFSTGTGNFILAFINNTGSSKVDHTMFLVDHTGKIVKTRKFTYSQKSERYLYKDNSAPAKYLIIDKKGIVHQVDTNLNTSIIAELNYDIGPIPIAVFDIDSDKNDEFLFSSTKAGIIILRHDFTQPIEISLPQNRNQYHFFSLSKIIRKNDTPLLFIQRGTTYYKYQYGYNLMYLLKYPIYLGIYVFVLLLILLIRKIQQLQIREKIDLQNSITELQLKTINNQLDPHFTFNAFNSIASLLKKEKGETAYSYFMKFSNLVRSNLVSADQISRTIAEELATIRDFLDIQQLRFDHSFEYEIKVDESVDLNTRIPKMMLQTYVENAVKHGFKHRGAGGLINIEVRKENKFLKLIVEDNGIGRKKATETVSDSTGMGLQIMQHYFELLNKYNAIKIQQSIIDLYDDSGIAAGTKVTLEMPEKINFNIYGSIK